MTFWTGSSASNESRVAFSPLAFSRSRAALIGSWSTIAPWPGSSSINCFSSTSICCTIGKPPSPSWISGRGWLMKSLMALAKWPSVARFISARSLLPAHRASGLASSETRADRVSPSTGSFSWSSSAARAGGCSRPIAQPASTAPPLPSSLAADRSGELAGGATPGSRWAAGMGLALGAQRVSTPWRVSRWGRAGTIGPLDLFWSLF